MSCQRCGRYSANGPFCVPCEDLLEAEREAEEDRAGAGVVRAFRRPPRPGEGSRVRDEDYRRPPGSGEAA